MSVLEPTVVAAPQRPWSLHGPLHVTDAERADYAARVTARMAVEAALLIGQFDAATETCGRWPS